MQPSQTAQPAPTPSHPSTTEPDTTSLSPFTPQICVICLYRITEKATCLPCNHDQYDFPCLGTWLQQNQSCPLCKSAVTAVKTAIDTPNPVIFQLPEDESDLPQRTTSQISRRRQRHRTSTHILHADVLKDAALAFRREVYAKKLYSLHVGTNSHSGYINLTPALIASSPRLIKKAKIFVRRELRIFEFLDPDSTTFGTTDRTATNVEFLLEYVIEVIKVVDLKGSAGQAEELLKDYLGRENARLFLHELEAWLRCPWERLEVWDRNVQYREGL